MIQILFNAPTADWDDYAAPLSKALHEKGITATIHRPWDQPAPDFAAIDYVIYNPRGPVQDFAAFTSAKAVLSLWAGVEKIVGNNSLTQPLCRMVDDGLELGMVQWVAGHTLRHHLDIDFYLSHQDGVWRQGQIQPPLPQDRTVAVLGLGALGAACARQLAGLGFRVLGWSRSQKSIEGVECHFGNEGLRDVLAQAEILATILPDTPATTDLLNAQTLALMPKGAVILNPGRGTVLVEQDLIAALDTGQVGHATLDVFRTEPVPADHPFWSHPNITVTPHIAAETRPLTAARVIAENIHRGETGQPFIHRVDRSRGY
ncbi:glyoxylate/hydroxypyruvate reductase A [Thioclava sp. SK-1]|uniref:2-hydroxyacid dehydrogenase n=1 Tax=Thioclava sp. SK-1 TaxID=1889770 RepID=UPI000826FFD0|nr:glyoxylate/hydroxypyruvate reductase A [Thioclava sp. SK-1]OCX66733.1 glyoxylate/hydroxypyruvate reductase A [Thioclava sp. SK-1]